MTANLFVFICCLLCVSGVADAFRGNTLSVDVFHGAEVISSSYDDMYCNTPITALSSADWALTTSCEITQSVSDCADANVASNMELTWSLYEYPPKNELLVVTPSPPPPQMRYCTMRYICLGWSGNVNSNDTQYLEMSIDPLGDALGITAVSAVRVHEKAARGYIQNITLIASDGYTHVVYTDTSKTLPTTYKPSPVQEAGKPYFAPGIDYRGGVNTTVNGSSCVGWTHQKALPWDVIGLGLGDHNFCRNPTNDAGGVWCFAFNPSTRTMHKEYCTIPVAIGCDDEPLSFTYPKPLDYTFKKIRITMKKLHGAIAAIDAVDVVGRQALECYASPMDGFFKPPHCEECLPPYKGPGCNITQCPDGTACVYGSCNADSSGSYQCSCYPSFYGASCSEACPTDPVNKAKIIAEPWLAAEANACSGHGMCSHGATGNGTCTCERGFGGSACAVQCPGFNATSNTYCSGAGTCNDGSANSGNCTCVEGRYDVDCAKSMCGRRQCWNGDCVGGFCNCYYNDTHGYYGGRTCTTCAAGYGGTGCKSKLFTEHVFEDSVVKVDQKTASVSQSINDVEYVLQSTTNSHVMYTVEGTGGYEVNLAGCRTTISTVVTKATCGPQSVGNTGTATLRINSFAIGTNHYKITVQYFPMCRVKCNHGYCANTNTSTTLTTTTTVTTASMHATTMSVAHQSYVDSMHRRKMYILEEAMQRRKRAVTELESTYHLAPNSLYSSHRHLLQIAVSTSITVKITRLDKSKMYVDFIGSYTGTFEIYLVVCEVSMCSSLTSSQIQSIATRKSGKDVNALPATTDAPGMVDAAMLSFDKTGMYEFSEKVPSGHYHMYYYPVETGVGYARVGPVTVVRPPTVKYATSQVTASTITITVGVEGTGYLHTMFALYHGYYNASDVRRLHVDGSLVVSASRYQLLTTTSSTRQFTYTGLTVDTAYTFYYTTEKDGIVDAANYLYVRTGKPLPVLTSFGFAATMSSSAVLGFSSTHNGKFVAYLISSSSPVPTNAQFLAPAGTQNIADGVRVDATVAHGMNYVRFPNLQPSKAYFLYYQAVSVDGFTRGTINDGATIPQHLTTTLTPDLALNILSLATEIKIIMTSNFAGTVWFLVTKHGKLSSLSVTEVVSMSASHVNVVSKTDAFSVVAGNTTLSLSRSLFANISVADIYWVSKAPTTGYSDKSRAVVFSPGGVTTNATVDISSVSGVNIKLSITAHTFGVLSYIIAPVSDVAGLAPPTRQEVSKGTYSLVELQGKFDMTPLARVEGVVEDVRPETKYVLFYVSTDTTGLYTSDVHRLHITTTSQGVQKCNTRASVIGQKITCTANAFEQSSGLCACLNGYECEDGACKSKYELEIQGSTYGTCACDSTTYTGKWNGTTCSSCAEQHFGSDCRSTCFVGFLPPGSTSKCHCPSNLWFTGDKCDQCLPSNGYYGDYCNETAKPATIVLKGESLLPQVSNSYGPYRTVAYGEVEYMVKMASSYTLDLLSSVEVILYKTFPSTTADTSSCGPGDVICEQQKQNDVSATVYENTTTLCHALDSWGEDSKSIGSCLVSVPRGYKFATLKITAKNTAYFDVQLRVTTPCCNGHGLCGNYTATCECSAEPTYGYWDDATQCASCITGFSGVQCNTYSGAVRNVSSGQREMSLGDSEWYAVDLALGTTASFNLDGTGDCDMSVKMTSICGDGWYYFNKRCFRPYYQTCYNFEDAKTQCTRQGGTIATPTTAAEINFMATMWEKAGLNQAATQEKMCHNQLHIGLKRVSFACSDTPTSYSGLKMPKEVSEKDCNSTVSTYCEWKFDALQSKNRCLTRDKYKCYNLATSTDCHSYTADGYSRIRVCQFEEYQQYVNGNTRCNFGWAWVDNRDTDESATELVRSSWNEGMGPNNWGQCNVDVNACTERPNFCIKNQPGQCVPKMRPPQSAPLDAMPIINPPPDSFWSSGYNCGRLQLNTYKDNITFLPGTCTNTSTWNSAVKSGLPDYGQAGVICAKSVTNKVSTLSSNNHMSTVASDDVMMSVPTASMISLTSKEQFSAVVDTTMDYALVRVTCLEPSTYSLNVSYVPRPRFLKGSSGACRYNHLDGFWAGAMCAECSPRYTGAECQQFIRCSDDCVHGTCMTSGRNMTIGHCKCYPGWYGLKCDTACNMATCSFNGTCNANYQRCNGTYGIESECTPSNSPLCHCNGNYAGTHCDTCRTGFWGKGCKHKCKCNGQSCNARTGKCECNNDDVRGHYNVASNCWNCAAMYYGVDCTRFCNPLTTCTGRGNCSATDGTCTCHTNSNYFGSSCSVFCKAETTCNGHGTCSDDGGCVCSANYNAGYWDPAKSCSVCLQGYWGEKCTNTCRCSLHGTCDMITGACTCYSDYTKGFWQGEECRICADGYRGSSCTYETSTVSNKMGVSHTFYVDGAARLTKSTEWGGALVVFQSVDKKTEYMFAATGVQIALFERDATRSYLTWNYVTQCNLKTVLGYGDTVTNAIEHKGYVYFGLQDPLVSYVVRMPTTAEPMKMNSSGCFFTSSDAVYVYDPRNAGENTTSAYASQLVSINLDSPRNVLYAIFKEYISTDSYYSPIFKLVKLWIMTERDFKMGTRLWSSYTASLLTYKAVSTAIINNEDAANPFMIIAGTDTIGNVLLTKTFLPTSSQPTVRPVFSFNPHVCTVVRCVYLWKLLIFDGHVYAAIQTYASSSYGNVVVKFDFRGTQLKNVTGHYKYVVSTETKYGVGFMSVDNETRSLYVSYRNATPGMIHRYDADTLTQYAQYLELNYENTLTEYQVPVASIMIPEQRVMYVLNRMTQMQVIAINLYDVVSITPTVVDGQGGSIVEVHGTGFRVLDPRRVIVCKFGSTYNLNSNATFVNSKLIRCKAPLVKGFDACEGVPLEVSFDDAERFTANSVLVRHVNLPTVRSIMPSPRSSLINLKPLTISGVGFLNTEYLSCWIDGIQVKGTFHQTTQISCMQPNRTRASQTFIEVSLDGQRFTNNQVGFKIIDKAVTMSYDVQDATQQVAKLNLPLPQIIVTLRDSAGNDVQDSDTRLTGHTITMQLIGTSGASIPLTGTVTLPIKNGVVTFSRNTVRVERPVAETQTISFSCSLSTIVAPSPITYTITAQASRISFVIPTPQYATSYAEFFMNTFSVAFTDEIGNIDVRSNVNGIVILTLESDQGVGNAQLLGSISKTSLDGQATFDNIRISNGVQGQVYYIRFTSTNANIASLRSGPIRLAFCLSSIETTRGTIGKLLPSAGRLLAASVTVRGYRFDVKSTCHYGSYAAPARFLDDCNVVCDLPARSEPFSAPLYLSGPNYASSNTNFNYSFIDVATSLNADVSGNTVSYQSAAVVMLKDITVQFKDQFGNWLREFDTVDRPIYVKTNMNLDPASYKISHTAANASIVLSQLKTVLPKEGTYVFKFTTIADDPMPTGYTQYIPTYDPNSIEVTKVVVEDAGKMERAERMGPQPLCPKRHNCVRLDRRTVKCNIQVNDETFTNSLTETQVLLYEKPEEGSNGGGSSSSRRTRTVTLGAGNGATDNIPGMSPPKPIETLFNYVLTVTITQGTPALMRFTNNYSTFITNRRQLDQQPEMEVTDVSGNRVTSFTSTPVVSMSVSPTAECQGTKSEAQTTAEFELSCERVVGAQTTVNSGVARFTSIQFRGVMGTWYSMHFSVTIANIPVLKSAPMYVSDCPTGNAPVSQITPNWATTDGGTTITVVGWDMQPDMQLKLTFGGDKLDCVYNDTCHCFVKLPTQTSAYHAHTYDHIHDHHRLMQPQQAFTAQAMSISLQDAANPTFQSSDFNFRVKAKIAQRMGFGVSARTAGLYRDLIVNTTADIPCVPAAENVAMDCVRAQKISFLDPIYIVQQDSAEGDLFAGYGWDSSINIDVAYKLNVTASHDPRDPSEIFKNLPFSGRTTNGITTIVNAYMVEPKSGDYVFTITALGTNKNGEALASGTYTIRVYQGPPVTLAFRNADSLPRSDDDPNAILVQRASNGDLNLMVELHDVNGNAISNGRIAQSPVLMKVQLTPQYVIQPSPLKNILLRKGRFDAADYGGDGAGSPALVDPSESTLGSAGFDFQTAKVINIWYGVLYNISFTITSPTAYTSIAPASALVQITNCKAASEYGKNLTSTCYPVPVGAQLEFNNSLFLSSQRNYWRYEFWDDRFFECAEDNCLGGFWSSCKRGTRGPTCAVCESGYGKEGDLCLECPNAVVNGFILFGISMAILFVIVLMVRTNLSTDVKQKSLFSIVLKVLMNHLQTASLMQEFQMKMTGIVKDIMGIQDKTTPDTNVSSFACATGWDQKQIFIMWMIIPGLLFVIPGLIALYMGMRKSATLGKRLSRLRQEIEQRHRLGLDAEDLETILHSLETGNVPEAVEDDYDSDEENDGDEAWAEKQDEEIEGDIDDVVIHERQEQRAKLSHRVHQRAQILSVQLEKAAERNIEAALGILQDPNSTDEDKENARKRLAEGPQNLVDGAEEARAAAADQPAQWEVCVSKTRKVPYWRNLATKEVTWIRPEGAPAPESSGGDRSYRSDASDVPFTDLVRGIDDLEGKDDVLAEDGINTARPKHVHQRKVMNECSICHRDFGVYVCLECADTQDLRKGMPFCESCYKVVHSSDGPNSGHVRRKFQVEQTKDVMFPTRYKTFERELKRYGRSFSAKEIFSVTVLVLVFLFYPRLMTQIAIMLKCREIKSIERSFLAADMRIECGTSEYESYKRLAQMFFFLYGVGIPLLGTIVLYRKRHKLLTQGVMSKFGFLYSGYRLTRYFWEFVIMLRKMLVVFIIVFYDGNHNFQIILGQWVIFAFLMLNIFAQPFQLRLLWRLENCSLASVAFTLQLALLYHGDFELSAAAESVVTALIFAINITVVTVFAYFLYYAAKVQFYEVFDTDGSGDVTLEEIKAVAWAKAFSAFGPTLRQFGFEEPKTEDELMHDKLEEQEEKRRATLLRRRSSVGLILPGMGNVVGSSKQCESDDNNDGENKKKKRISLVGLQVSDEASDGFTPIDGQSPKLEKSNIKTKKQNEKYDDNDANDDETN
eukprot:PhM_4_TR16815/c1_g1_i2/m.104511